MHKPKPVPKKSENETNKIVCDFEIQTDQLIPNRWVDLQLTRRKELVTKL